MYKIYTKEFPILRRRIHKLLLVMRLTTVLLIVAIMQVNASTLAQKITLKQNNISLEEVFQVIRKQTGYNVLYLGVDIKAARSVDADFKNQNLEEVLKAVLADQALTYEIDNKTVVVKEKTKSFYDKFKEVFSAIEVIGRVVDEHGLPIPGATVKLKDGSLTTTTNKDGVFSFRRLDDKAVIVISFIGYQTKELSVKTDLGDIKLELSNSKLDEVKVIGYGTTTQRLTTGSLSTISAAEIARQPVSNVLAAMANRIPGLQISQNTGMPGGNFTVKLRGVNTLTGNADPLYLVDGVPFPSSSLTKLADLNAAQFSSPLNAINPNDIESITVLKDAAATAIYGARGANGVILITMKKEVAGDTKVNMNAYMGIGQNPREKQMMNTTEYLAAHREALKNGGSTPTATNAPDLVIWDPNANTDWQKQLLGRNAVYKDIQASVSGGSDETAFLIGTGYHQESTDFAKDPAIKKIALNFSIGHTSKNKRLVLSLTGNYMNDRTLLPSADPAVYAAQLVPNRPPLIVNGALDFSNGSNPLAPLYRPYHSEKDNLVASGSLSYRVLPGLFIKSTFGYNTITSNETQLIPLTTLNPSPLITSGNSAFGDNRVKTWNIEPQITYDKTIGKGHFSALIGSTIQSSFNHGIRYAASGFVNDAFLTDIQAAKTVTISSLTDGITKYNSYFARVDYAWDEKYIADLTGRRDGSSRFGPGNKYGNFGAAGLAWIFSKENFIAQNIPFLSFGKLRVSYGSVGNAPGSDYNYLSQWGTLSNAYDGIGGLYPLNLFNEVFQWETTIKKELGLDLEFFKGRLAVNTDYYLNRSSNQLVNYPLPNLTGFSGIYSNLPATIQNNGWEFTLQSANIQTKNLRWTSSFNFSAPRNKLVEFTNLASSTYSGNYIIGQPIYIKQLSKYVDVDPATGIYRFAGPSGPVFTPTSTGPKVLFDPTPRYYGGLGNNVKFKNFELDFFFSFTKQKAINNDGFTSSASTNLPVRYLDRWQKPGDVAQNQKLSSSFDAFLADSYAVSSDKYLVDASFIRLKNVSLAYNIPANYMQRIHFKSGRIYFQGQNLLTITKFQGLDPETGNANTALLRVMTAGLQFTF